MTTAETEQLQRTVSALLAQIGETGECNLVRILGGRNNRVYRVELSGRTLIAKHYFTHPDDIRDRLAAEFAFCEYAWSRGVTAVPRPLACAPADNLALYELIDGAKLASGEVARPQVDAAADFFRDLNAHRDKPDAHKLPNASEACFSIAEHVRCAERRVAALDAIEPATDDHAAARRFVRTALAPAWRKLAAAVESQAADRGRSVETPLEPIERCLSPSDFGFHNALVRPDGLIRFLDFEYAGWDDPAKMVCDFFCQPQVPVPLEFFEPFAAAAADSTGGVEQLLSRTELLLPVYQLKWCCILLNDFLPLGNRRRRFGQDEQPDLKAQLDKAVAAFESVG